MEGILLILSPFIIVGLISGFYESTQMITPKSITWVNPARQEMKVKMDESLFYQEAEEFNQFNELSNNTYSLVETDSTLQQEATFEKSVPSELMEKNIKEMLSEIKEPDLDFSVNDKTKHLADEFKIDSLLTESTVEKLDSVEVLQQNQQTSTMEQENSLVLDIENEEIKETELLISNPSEDTFLLLAEHEEHSISNNADVESELDNIVYFEDYYIEPALSHEDYKVIEKIYGEEVANKITATPQNIKFSDHKEVIIGRLENWDGRYLLNYRDSRIQLILDEHEIHAIEKDVVILSGRMIDEENFFVEEFAIPEREVREKFVI